MRALLAHPEIDADTADDIEGMTPLMHTARLGNEAMAHLFLSLGPGRVDINRRDAKGRTLLLWAARTRCWDSFLCLLDKHHADPTIADQFGQTVLAFAAEAGETAVVESLIAVEGVDVDSKDIGGLTPYFLACCLRNTEIEELLKTRLGPQAPRVVVDLSLYKRRTIRILNEIRDLNFDPPGGVLTV